MIVVQVTDDDIGDCVRRNAKRRKPFAHRLDDLTLAAAGHRLVEAGIDDDGAGPPDDRPDEIIERLQDIVRIAADEVFARSPRVMRVADRVDFVRVLVQVLAQVLVQVFLRIVAHAAPGFADASGKS